MEVSDQLHAPAALYPKEEYSWHEPIIMPYFHQAYKKNSYRGRRVCQSIRPSATILHSR